ncbi:MAG: sulfatase-like hydrolase/transferase [Haloplanus sp.]
MTGVRNLVVYMADGVRWDHHPDAVAEMGTTFRGIAASTHTPSSIASMLTGLHLPTHGVRGFTDPLPADVETMLEWFSTAGLSESPGNFNDVIYGTLLGRYDRVSLADATPPFGWFMRDAGGHAPYDGFDGRLQTDESVRSYLRDHAGDEARMRRDYAAAVESSVERFERFVLQPLRERDLLAETLVVFLSDHGQLLGEYGHVGESYPACPEVVYVPVTFVHPDLPRGEKRPELFRHVDVPATVAGLLAGVDASDTQGRDLFADGDHPDYGATFYDRPYPSFLGEFSYTIDSLWERDGGHVFVRSGAWTKCKLAAGFLSRIPAGTQLRRSRSALGLKMLFENRRTWGDPTRTASDAEAILDALKRPDVPDPDLTLSEDAVRNLRELGYL